MVWTEKRKENIFLISCQGFQEEGRERQEVEGRRNQPAPADPCTQQPEQAGGGHFSPLGPGPEEPGSRHSLRVQRARHLAGWGVSLGGGGGDYALEFEGIQGWLGPGPPSLPSLGLRLYLRNPSFWEEWPSGFCLKQLGRRHPRKLQEQPEPPRGQPWGSGALFPSCFHFCGCSLLWQTQLPWRS